MNICTNRLKTFNQHEPPWPYIDDRSYHAPEEFANAGFYNVSTKRSIDKVQCYICNVTLTNWKQGQSPLGRHAHAAKTCPLVLLNFPDALTTVPIVDQDPNTHPESDFMIKIRLKTFTKNRAWPPSSTTNSDAQSAQKRGNYPTSTKMAEAGFVFLPTLNEPDRVKCPYCQFSPSNLNSTSNPWIQHQKAKPDCLYVTRRKAILPTTRSSLPQKRSTPGRPSTATAKKSRRATTDTYDKENAAKAVNDQDGTTGTNENNTNEAGLLSRFDDSIWDIAKAEMNFKKAPDLTTATRQRPSNGKSLVTYERKKKRPSKVLPPELTKPKAASSSTATTANTRRSKEKTTTSQSNRQVSSSKSSHQEQPTTTATSQQRDTAEETPAQVIARLQKKSTVPISTKDKGKGRASDFLMATSSLPPPSNTNKLTKDSLRLSTSNSRTTSRINMSQPTASSSSATATSTEPVSQPIDDLGQSYRIFASTPSRRSNLDTSAPLPHSTPIHARIDHGNDLMALTLSPIRGAGNMATNTESFNNIFGSLDTPRTTNGRTEQQMKDGDDGDIIAKQIEQQFRSKRHMRSPTRSTSTLQQKQADMYHSGTPLLDFDDSDEIQPPPHPTPSTPAGMGNRDPYLTDEQLAMTVEGFIQSLVESKVDMVREHGERLIKGIEEEVADTKKFLLTNHL